VSHIAAAVAVAVVSAGGAVEVQQQLVPHHRDQAAIHRSVVPSAAPALRTAAIGTPALVPDAARQREAMERLRLRVPGLIGEPPADEAPVPTLEADNTGNGGVAAPVEPPTDTLDPVTPPTDAAVVEGADPSATSGSPVPADAPPASGSSAAEPMPAADPPAAAPPATSAAPSASTAPTPATVGGAAYQGR
jgi:hypothetical protein